VVPGYGALVKLLILTQYYPPEVGAPQNRLSDFAQRMVAFGHEVTVVTAMPNYPTGSVFREWRGKVIGQERIDGVHVLRSWILGPGRGSTLRQLISYGSFLLSAGLTAPFRSRGADVVLWESPPLFLTPTASILARRHRARIAMNVSDLWPQSAVDLGMLRSSSLQRFFRWWERRSYKTADLVLGQTEHIVAGVSEVCPETPVGLFPNGVDIDFFQPRERDEQLIATLGIRRGARIVGYIGTFGRAQALEQVLEAADRLRDRDDVVFLLMGDGPRALAIQRSANERGLKNVVYQPPQPRENMPSILSVLDLALVPLADRPIFDGARPSKMFELFAAEVPTIFCGRGEGAELARAAGALVVPPEQPEQLAAEMSAALDQPRELLRQRGRRGREFVVANYDRIRIAKGIEAKLIKLADS
jgi:glycosyltransferase involved in cell wall biosynthesis